MIIKSELADLSLQHLIKEYYYFSKKMDTTVKYVPVIDDCCYDFVFFKECNSVLTYGEKQSTFPIPFKVFTIHDLSPPYTLKFEVSLTFFTIKVQPWANAHFFSYLDTSGIIDLSIEKKGILGVREQLFNDVPISDMCTIASDFIKDQNLILSSSALFVKEVCEYIYSVKGMTSVNLLSEKYKKTRQYLNRIFKQEVLYSLKKFIITVRIMDLVKFRIKNKHISMTELCYTYDYFDQSHFNRDFKKVCGVTPMQFFNDLPEFLFRH